MRQEVKSFRGIRYAKAERFEPAERVPFDGAIEGRPRGPIPFQSPSRLAMVLGPQQPLEQSEDCLVLSVFTPSCEGARPVMIWLHGGAFITGGGQLDWYDGDKLASEQDVVVVSINYRLGAFGFLSLADDGTPSPAMTDQVAAIEWVRDHISQFGGDPDNITLFGQSAGGIAIDMILRWGHASLIQHAIFQSGNAGTRYLSRSDLEYRRQRFLECAGKDPRLLAPTELLEAQKRFATEGGELLPWGPVAPEVAAEPRMDIIAGWTAHDSLPFVLMSEGRQHSPSDIVELASQIDERNGMFRDGSIALAKAMSARGANAWLYKVTWSSPGSTWGATHCVELPLLLGSPNAWSAAPMLAGVDPDELEDDGRTMRAIWGQFAKTGDPGDRWTQYSNDDAPIAILANGFATF